MDVWRWELYRDGALFSCGLAATCVLARAKALVTAVAATEGPEGQGGTGKIVLDEA
jgi:hypothetical protein